MSLKMNKAALLSGSTIGILGGGQLGQMLSMAASRLGFKTHIFEPSAHPPATNVSPRPAYLIRELPLTLIQSTSFAPELSATLSLDSF